MKRNSNFSYMKTILSKRQSTTGHSAILFCIVYYTNLSAYFFWEKNNFFNKNHTTSNIFQVYYARRNLTISSNVHIVIIFDLWLYSIRHL